MELEQIQELLNALKTELLQEVDRRNQGLAASLNRDIRQLRDQAQTQTQPEETTEATNPTGNPRQSLADKALQTQLDELRSQLSAMQQAKEAAEKQQFISERDAFLSSHLSGLNLTSTSAVRKLLLAEYGDSIKRGEDGNWYLENGDTATPLTQAIDTYLQSDEGRNFLPANPGSGTTPTQRVTAPTGDSDPFKVFAQQLTQTSL